MHKFFTVFILLLFVQSNTTEFTWRQDYKLTWEDFKGAPNYNSDAVAVTASGISFGFSVKQSTTKVYSFTATADAHFYPEHSWHKPELSNTHILGHEQLHFDITELNVRQLRARIAQLKPQKGINTTLEQLNETANKELAEMQKLYDTQTNYSINKEQQVIWEKKIVLALAKLEKYKSK